MKLIKMGPIFRDKTSKKNSHNVTIHQKIIMSILMSQKKSEFIGFFVLNLSDHFVRFIVF